MAFSGTVGGSGNVLVHAISGTTIGSLDVTLSLIGSSGPKEQDSGLFDLEVKHIHLSEAYTTWAAVATPFDPNAVQAAGGATYDKETDTDAASLSTALYKVCVYIGPLDEDSGDCYTLAFLAKLARGNRDFATAKLKYNELTSKLVGQVPSGTISIVAAKYGSLVTGADTSITATAPTSEQWLAKV